MNKTLLGAAMAAVLMVAGGAAFAKDTGPKMSDDEVKAKIEAAGYTEVKHIHKERNYYDATAMKDGKKVKLKYDPATGDISPDTEEHHTRKGNKED